MITPTREPVLREIHTAPVTEEDWLPRLAHDIVSEHRQAQESAQTAVAHARRAGELLVQAKHRVVKHGEWAAWCEAELPFGERMAQRYMKVARELPRLPAQQAEQISEMSLRDVLKMLSEPKEPRNGKADSPKNKDLEPKTTRVSDLNPPATASESRPRSEADPGQRRFRLEGSSGTKTSGRSAIQLAKRRPSIRVSSRS